MLLSAARLLDAWELGLTQGPVRRALTLLAAGSPTSSVDDLAARPIGRRDRDLAALRERLFGSRLPLVSRCPACAELVECAVSMADLCRPGSPPPVGGEEVAEIAGFRVSYRLPTSLDLLALSPAEEPAALRRHLLARCVREARDASGPVSPEHLPAPVVAGIADAMAQADPGGEVRLDLTCPACGHHWPDSLDIADVLWKEVHAWAQRTLRDVHALARAYGWREADVLALTPTRRHVYLELSQR
jgi:hypothetical protein